LKKYKSPGTDLTLAELIQAEGERLCFEIYKPFNSTLNQKELPQQWKKSLTVPLCKNGNKTDCSNYQGIPLLSTSYKILFNILLSRLSPHINEIIGDHHCGFRHNRPPTDQMFCIRVCHKLEKKLENDKTVHDYSQNSIKPMIQLGK
jgi:hypothetical protein